jgi:hypothetical protein
LILLEDGSISSNGKIIFVSLRRFKEKVCRELVCFVCADEMAEPTKEHVVPDWVLRKFSLHNQFITLPNGTLLKYANYVIPCCWSCNQLLSKELETPISKAFNEGFEGVKNFLANGYGQKLFSWLALIFIKMHYKDNLLPANRDRRSVSGTISKEMGYDWGDMHHTYCLARTEFSKATVRPEALGSLGVFSILRDSKEREPFDIGGFTFANTFSLRIGDVGVIACFGDGGAVLYKLNQLFLQKLEGKLSFPQFRELLAHFACCRLHLKNPPTLSSLFDKRTRETIIVCTERDGEPEFHNFDRSLLGKLMKKVLYESAKNSVDVPNFMEALESGELSFLFSNDGTFIKHSEDHLNA